MRPTTATDTVNNSHPRFVVLPLRSGVLIRFPLDSLPHSVHRALHDAPCASATSSRLLRGVLFRKETISAMTSQAVISSNPLLAPLSPRQSPDVVGRTILWVGLDRFPHPTREEERFPRPETPSIDRSELWSPRSALRSFGEERSRDGRPFWGHHRPRSTRVLPRLASLAGIDLVALPPRSNARHRFTRRGLPL